MTKEQFSSLVRSAVVPAAEGFLPYDEIARATGLSLKEVLNVVREHHQELASLGLESFADGIQDRRQFCAATGV